MDEVGSERDEGGGTENRTKDFREVSTKFRGIFLEQGLGLRGNKHPALFVAGDDSRPGYEALFHRAATSAI